MTAIKRTKSFWDTETVDSDYDEFFRETKRLKYVQRTSPTNQINDSRDDEDGQRDENNRSRVIESSSSTTFHTTLSTVFESSLRLASPRTFILCPKLTALLVNEGQRIRRNGSRRRSTSKKSSINE